VVCIRADECLREIEPQEEASLRFPSCIVTVGRKLRVRSRYEKRSDVTMGI
jgi:hypothetical protein